MVVWSISTLRREAGSPYLSHPHQIAHTCRGCHPGCHAEYCIISIAPPTGHRKLDKHHPIYMTFVFSTSYTTTWHASNRWEHPLMASHLRHAWSKGPFIIACSFSYFCSLHIIAALEAWTYLKTHQHCNISLIWQKIDNSASLGGGVALPPTSTYMNEIQYAYLSWPDTQITHTLIPTGSRPFWFSRPFRPISMPRT